MTSVLDEVRLPRSLAQANEQLRREIAAHEATRRELAAMRREQGRLAEQLGAEIQRYETALRGSNVAVYTQDLNLRYTAVSKPLFGIAIDDLLGRTDDDVLPAESRAPIVALKRQVLEGGISKNGEFRIEERWYDFHIEPLRDVTGGIVGLTCAAVDVTERKKGEEHLRLVMRELTHRSKNLLAVIQAMARQTARHTPGADGYLDRFAGRLQALACSH